MKKLLLSFFLIFAIAIGYSQTYISGGIYSNATWTASGNPYIVTENTVVFAGVTLTIDPGVVVKFDIDTGLELRGKLIAIGNSTSQITFTSNSNSPQMYDWDGITIKGTGEPFGVGNQVTMEHCIGEYARHFINFNNAYNGPYIFNNCYFNNNYQGNNGGGPPYTTFEDCTFESNNIAVDGHQDYTRVINSTFINNINGVDGAGVVDSCYFTGNTGIALAPYGETSGCTLENNYVGVRCFFNDVNDIFVNNTVIDNFIGVDILSFFNGVIEFTGNTICNNTNKNIRLLTSNNADLSDNCWCSSDSSEISSSILDGYVDTNYGLVNFMPFSTDCPGIPLNVTDSSVNSIDAIVFPNPIKTTFDVVIESNESFDIIVYTIGGKKIFQQKFIHQINIDMHKYSSGFYFYQIRGTEGILKKGRLLKTQ